MSMGCFDMPDIFTETMKAKDTALWNSKKTIVKVFNEWGKQFGRKYKRRRDVQEPRTPKPSSSPWAPWARRPRSPSTR